MKQCKSIMRALRRGHSVDIWGYYRPKRRYTKKGKHYDK